MNDKLPAVLRIVYIFIPYGSKRWLVLKSTMRILRHPGAYLKLLSWKRLKEYVHVLSVEDRIQYDRKVDEKIDSARSLTMVPDLPGDKPEILSETLQIPDFDQPELLFVYAAIHGVNSFFSSINSILQTVTIPYHVILSGDCTEHASDLSQTKILSLDENQIAEYIVRHRSIQYIGLMDGNCILQPDSVQSCLMTFHKDPQVAMVVPRIFSTMSTMVSGGVILWKSGSYTSYGEGGDFLAPEYNYVKEVDSGDHISVVSRECFLEGITDQSFPFSLWPYPIHDLAMKMRALGNKVVYQPLAQILLVDRQNDSTRARGKELFFERWGPTLQNDHLEEYPDNVFIARERGQFKKYMLIIDSYIPLYDRDAGSRTMQHYIELFIEKGYIIKFVSDNFYPEEKYRSALEQNGIEVLHGDYYEANLQEWLQLHGKTFPVIFLSRPAVAIKYMEMVRKFTSGKILYYGHDLHYLRFWRQYQIEKKEEQLQEAERFKLIEGKIFEFCDGIYYPSQAEIDIVRSVFTVTKPARTLTPYIYDNFPARSTDWMNRQGLMFIGNFYHVPNVDAVLWFLEDIWPEVLKSLHGIVFSIAGQDPPESITSQHSDHVNVVGWISEEELNELYARCKMMVAPLRYGAGLKGKIVEAMYHGLPVVTTSIGAEGLEGTGHILQITDDAAAFAQKIIDLYANETELQRISETSVEYVKNNFSKDRAFSIIQHDLI